MKERIRELANGQVEFSRPALAISTSKIENMKPDGVYKACLVVESENGVAVKGVIYSSHNRVSLQRSTFYGRSNEILFDVNTYGLKERSLIEGGFTLVTNAGVFKVPFSYTVTETLYGINNRKLHELKDFCALVKEDPESAYRVFRSKNFTKLPIFENMNQIALYQTLSCDENDERAVEEFLSVLSLKESLRFSFCGDTTKNYAELMDDVSGSILLSVNTWGYGKVEFHCDANFIELSHKVAYVTDFKDQKFELKYKVLSDLLAVGTNIADIVISSSKGDLVYRICVAQKEKTKYIQRQDIIKKQISVELTKSYMEYRRLACIEPDGSEAKKKLDELIGFILKLSKESKEEIAYSLMLIFAYLLKGRVEDAEPILDRIREKVVSERFSNVRNYCFYLYLRARFTELADQMETAASLINKYYTEGGQDPVLLFLLIEADGSMKNNKSLVLLRLKELYKNGCRSPLLYELACEAFREQPDLLRVLNSFELQAVYYGARKEILTKELAAQIAKAASHELQYKPFTCRMLTFLYRKYPTDDMLKMLCSYLIRSGCTQKRFFNWYRLGVERKLNLVSLYDFYMESIPEDFNEPIPQEVLLYYTYGNHIQDSLLEILYANVLAFYSPDTQVYKAFGSMMEEYALSKLLEGRISRKLVPLYRHLVLQEMIDERLARVLPNLLVAKEFTCANKNMKRMLLRYPELNYEDTYPLEQGVCIAPVFADECMVFFEDHDGCRFCDVPYTTEKLFSDEELLKRCEEVYPNFFMFRLKKTKELLNKKKLAKEDVVGLKTMLHVAEISTAFRQKLAAKLLDYDLSKDEFFELLSASMDYTAVKSTDRKKVLEALLRLGEYDTVYQLIIKYGFGGLKNESLLLLVSNLLKSPAAKDDKHLRYLCLYLFTKNVYSPAAICFLATYFDGPSDQMLSVLRVGHENHFDCYDLAERVMAQKLFSGDWDDLDEVYTYYKEDCKVHELIERAYYVVCSYEYFVLEKEQPQKVFDYLERACMLDERPYAQIDICNIALLYYYSHCEHLPQKELEYCEELLNNMCKKGLMFGFYGKLWKKVACPASLNGKYLLEHRTKSAKRVFLSGHFADEKEEKLIKMQEMYSGIYVSQVVLFSDEVWTYSILEETDEGMKVVVKDEILSNDLSFVREGSFFDEVNHLGKQFAANDEKKLEKTLIDREAKHELMKKLFDVM